MIHQSRQASNINIEKDDWTTNIQEYFRMWNKTKEVNLVAAFYVCENSNHQSLYYNTESYNSTTKHLALYDIQANVILKETNLICRTYVYYLLKNEIIDIYNSVT